jgi:spermidine dehydrogenase
VLQRKFLGRSPGPLSAIGWEAVEYYFWGAFGASASETSAYHGLNFFAAEYGDLLIFPGGNGYITRRLGERLAPREIARTGAWVLRIEPAAEGGYAVIAHEQGRLHRHRARAVVFASPLFLAPRLIPSLPAAQREAIASFDYRAYIVANLLLGRRIDQIFQARAFRDGYELTRVVGADIRSAQVDRLSQSNGFSDAIAADFPIWRHATHGVLTVYRPYPYAAGRADVLEASYRDVEADVHRAILEGFGRHGLRRDDILETRIARWGHAMILPRLGQLADGTMKRASAPLPGLWFAHTDVQGAPAFENALAAAFDAADAVEAHLR